MDTFLAAISLAIDSQTTIYLILFFLLAWSGTGLSFPEEIIMFFGGYLAYLEFTRIFPTLFVMVLGLLAGDIIGYGIGRFGGQWISDRLFNRWRLTTSLIEKSKYYFEKHGEKVVIFSRPFLGIRVVVPMFFGHFRMNFVRFIRYDVVAVIPWTVFLFFLSYYLGSSIDLITEARELKHFIFIGIAFAVIFYSVLLLIKNFLLRDNITRE